MRGNEAVAEAAIIAGCRYYFAYPITPQNEIAAYMAMRMPEVGGTFLQAESEIASINMVLGAAAAGARTMTSSSSPGISLKQEGLSYLAGTELPAVVVNMMRGGPGLGNIAGAQGDYFQATKGGGHGDYHMIVLAPTSVQELADLTVDAFDLSDKYRIVTMILGDGYLGQMSESLVLPGPPKKHYDKSSWILDGASGRSSRIIASLRLKPEDELEKLNLHLQDKYRAIEAEEIRYECYQCQDAEVLLVAFGLSARMCKAAVNQLRAAGAPVGLFRPITLWPFPYRELKQKAQKVKKVLVVEMNAGQMLEDVRLALGDRISIEFYGRMGAMLVEVEEIIKRVANHEK
jgi:2-oxoglutarate ferredoxin oxidoreductase subunit alpha